MQCFCVWPILCLEGCKPSPAAVRLHVTRSHSYTNLTHTHTHTHTHSHSHSHSHYTHTHTHTHTCTCTCTCTLTNTHRTRARPLPFNSLMSSPSHTLGATRRSTGNTTLTRCAFMRVDGCFCTLDCVLHMPSFASVYYPLLLDASAHLTVSCICHLLRLSTTLCYWMLLHT